MVSERHFYGPGPRATLMKDAPVAGGAFWAGKIWGGGQGTGADLGARRIQGLLAARGSW